MVPEFGCQLQLGISEIHSAKVGSNLPSLSLEGMTSHTPFIHKEAGSFGWIFGQKLGEGSSKKKKDSHQYDR
jgi:hypothetical protein